MLPVAARQQRFASCLPAPAVSPAFRFSASLCTWHRACLPEQMSNTETQSNHFCPVYIMYFGVCSYRYWRLWNGVEFNNIGPPAQLSDSAGSEVSRSFAHMARLKRKRNSELTRATALCGGGVTLLEASCGGKQAAYWPKMLFTADISCSYREASLGAPSRTVSMAATSLA